MQRRKKTGKKINYKGRSFLRPLPPPKRMKEPLSMVDPWEPKEWDELLKCVLRQATHPRIILKDLYIKPLEQQLKDLKQLERRIKKEGYVSEQLAKDLAAALYTTKESWLNLQKTYDQGVD